MNNAFISTVLPIILLIAVFYFLLIRPQNKAMKERNQMLSALKAGDRVETVGRIFGTIYEIRDDVVILDISETSSTVRIKIAVAGIARVIRDDITGISDAK